jgi:hypothetical protein
MSHNKVVAERLHLAENLRTFAVEAGFELCGVASIDDLVDGGFPELSYFPEWIAQGQAGEMEYLKARNEE